MASKKKGSKKSKGGEMATAGEAGATGEMVFTAGENPRIVSGGEPEAQEPMTREKHGAPYTRPLPTEATATELSVLAHELADVLDEEARVKEDKRNANAVYREKLAGLDDRKKTLSECVKTDRKIEAVIVQEFIRSDNMVEVVRTDTGALVETRTATSDDLQRDVPLDGVNKKVKHKKLAEEPDDDDDDACPECGSENDAHANECSRVQVCPECAIVGGHHRPECESKGLVGADAVADTEAPESTLPDGTDTGDLAMEQGP